MSELEKLENFLLENSNISKDFIINFFGVQKKILYSKYKPFTIDLQDIAFWLDTRKPDLNKLLTKYYAKGLDYIIVTNSLRAPAQQVLTHGGQNRKLVLLTSDVFKSLCMRSKTSKANKVREYYIELEKLIELKNHFKIKN
jgi:phage anti-repressor protein